MMKNQLAGMMKQAQAMQENMQKMQQMFPMFSMMDWTNFQKK